jgi:hypothetical protein
MVKLVEKRTTHDKFTLIPTKKGNKALKSRKSSFTYTYDLNRGGY